MIEGDVRYAGFRNYIENLANRYDLAGFACNDCNEKNVKFVCEGEISKIGRSSEEISRYPGVKKVSYSEKILLPKPVGRVVGGVEKDIFDGPDLGVDRPGSIDSKPGSADEHLTVMEGYMKSVDARLNFASTRLGSIGGTLKESTGLFRDITDILRIIAEK